MSINLQDGIIFQINKLTGSLPDIDNEKLSLELISANKNRLSDDPTDTSYEDFVLPMQDGSEVKNLIEKMKEVGESIGHCIDGAWYQVHHKYESTSQHTHYDKNKDIALSWCYYVSADENSGDLVFMFDSNGSDFIGSLHKPVVGTFVIFPSFIKHKVNKNMSDNLRISIAGNFIPFGGRGAYR